MYVKMTDETLCIIIFQPNVRVLNYAPGPLLTDMYETIRTTCGNHEVVEMFNTSKEEVSITVFMLPYMPLSLSIFVHGVPFSIQRVRANSNDICVKIYFPSFAKNGDVSIFVRVKA